MAAIGLPPELACVVAGALSACAQRTATGGQRCWIFVLLLQGVCRGRSLVR
jgi:hypothetical protein